MGFEAVLERYRCPEDFVRMEVADVAGAPEGFFKFGNDAVCYGRALFSRPSSRLTEDLPDAQTHVKVNGGVAVIPFDPDEVTTNLQYERYLLAARRSRTRSSFSQIGRDLYYWLRPAMSKHLRSYAKRLYMAGWEKTPFPQWPVDTSVELLLERLLELSLRAQGMANVPFIWFWPHGFGSCCVMTHDVETAAGLDYIGAVMQLDDQAEIKGSFQLVPEDRYVFHQDLLSGIRSRGFEVNLHDLNHDGRLFDNRDQFLARARRINAYALQHGIKGYRSGVMYRNQDWYAAFDLEYDMSVPNVAHLDPQRGGCCTVMPYFIGNILELPLTTIQDYSLFYLLKEYSIERWREQIVRIMRAHGLMSFIIHPDYVINSRHRAVFRELLKYLADLRGAGKIWSALPGEVNRWWRQRSKMRLVRHGTGWRIEGEGSERACVAFADIQDGKLEYRISQPLSGVDLTKDLVAVRSEIGDRPSPH